MRESDEQPEQVHLISTLPIACGGCGNDEEDDDGDGGGDIVAVDGATCYQRFRIHSPGGATMLCKRLT